tara:strand:+ start:305 stop:505 length:201 start_codon:yes stop_codon:yes gene_type:complete
MLTKREEINRLRNFVAKQEPEGYLAMILNNALLNHIEIQIGNDFGFIDYEAMMHYEKRQVAMRHGR